MCLKISSRILTGITITVPMDLLFLHFRTSGRHLPITVLAPLPLSTIL